jgi:hypothetical protein
VYRGHSLTLSLPFEPNTLGRIKVLLADQQDSMNLMRLIELKDQLSHDVATIGDDQNYDQFNDLEYYLLETDLTCCGLLGIAIANLMAGIRGTERRPILSKATELCRSRYSSETSTITEVSDTILAQSRDNMSLPIIIPADMNVALALGFCFAERRDFFKAKSLLETVSTADASRIRVDTFEYTLAQAELVNCLNYLGEHVKGDRLASKVLSQLNANSRIDALCLSIAKTDSLIGQEKYAEAESSLMQLSEGHRSTNFLHLATNLRLNKVRRRLGQISDLMLDEKSPLAGIKIQALPGNLSATLEWVEEVSSTAFQLTHTHPHPEDGTGGLPIGATFYLDKLDNMSDWRIQYAQEQCLRAYTSSRNDPIMGHNVAIPSENELVSKQSTRRRSSQIREPVWRMIKNAVPKELWIPTTGVSAGLPRRIETSAARSMELFGSGRVPIHSLFSNLNHIRGELETPYREFDHSVPSIDLQSRVLVLSRGPCIALQPTKILPRAKKPGIFFWARCATFVHLPGNITDSDTIKLHEFGNRTDCGREIYLVSGYIRYHRPRVFNAEIYGKRASL